ncbi:hypothetical protein LLH00_06435 [bacterium]|nr:hypothetical protein [bacterium]
MKNVLRIRPAAACILVLALALCAAGVRAEQITRMTGNKVGMWIFGGPDMPMINQIFYPKGSGNSYTYQGPRGGMSGMAVAALADLDGNGTLEDTIKSYAKSWEILSGCAQPWNEANLDAAFKANISSKVYTGWDHALSSLSKADLEIWPPDFRDRNGDPLLYGSETVVVYTNDVLNDHPGWPNSGAVFGEHPLGVACSNLFFAFSLGLTEDIIFQRTKIYNATPFFKYNLIQEYNRIPAYTFHNLAAGMFMFYETGAVDDERIGVVNSQRLVFEFDSDCREVPWEGIPGCIGFCFLQNLTDYKTGVELPVLNLTGTDRSGIGSYGQGDVDAYLWYTHQREVKGGLSSAPPFQSGNTELQLDLQIGFGYCLGTSGVIEDFAPWDSAYFEVAHLATEGRVVPSSPDQIPMQNLTPMLALADAAHALKAIDYIQPSPPASPEFELIPGNGEVTITWNDMSVFSKDPFYEAASDPHSPSYSPGFIEKDFQGFRLYRSFRGPAYMELLAEWDLADGITTENNGITNHTVTVVDKDGKSVTGETTAIQDTVKLGTDTGLEFFYRDTDRRLVNGFKVWYAVTAYDYNPAQGVMSLESTTQTARAAIPRSDASGWRAAGESTFQLYPDGVTRLEEGGGTVHYADSLMTDPPLPANPFGLKQMDVVNAELVKPGRLDFVVDSIFDGVGVIAVAPVTYYCHWERDGQMLDTISVVIGSRKANPPATTQEAVLPVYRELAGDGTLVLEASVSLVHPGVDTDYQAQLVDLGGYNGASEVQVNFNKTTSQGQSVRWAVPSCMRLADIELRWEDAGGGRLTLAVEDKTNRVNLPFSPYLEGSWGFVPRDGWDTVRKERCATRSSRTTLLQSEFDPLGRTDLDIYVSGNVISLIGINTPPAVGQVWLLRCNKIGLNETGRGEAAQPKVRPAIPGSHLRFEIAAASNQPENTDFNRIKVVPNPYLVSGAWDLGIEDKRIEFINLPSDCTIRIYTLAGDLVQVLRHQGANPLGHQYDTHGGTEAWNLKNRFGSLIASGQYFYHVTDARGKQTTGRFFVIE